MASATIVVVARFIMNSPVCNFSASDWVIPIQLHNACQHRNQCELSEFSPCSDKMTSWGNFDVSSI
jgi:hypothetical protein